jgi:DNA-binding HxlR family transcriptional regulator
LKNLIENINKVFESRIRLGIMSLLMVHDWIEFTALKELLNTSDGNLASHVAALEKAGFLIVNKSFVGKKPNTSYAATKAGKKAFKDHLDALEKLIKDSEKK